MRTLKIRNVSRFCAWGMALSSLGACALEEAPGGVGDGDSSSAGVGGTSDGATSTGGGAVGEPGTGGASNGGMTGTGGVGAPTVVETPVCGSAAENGSVQLSCPDGGVITRVEFASFGEPTGECGALSAGACHAADSESVVETACVGQISCEVSATNDAFGGDPCPFTAKSLSVEVICSTSGTPGGTGGASGSGGETSTGGTNTGGNNGTGGGTTTPDGCPTEMVGFATVNAEGVNGTTGGGNATPITVTNLSELRAAVQDSSPQVVIVSGTIETMADGNGYPLEVKSNKTVVGADANATIVGGLTMKNVENVIISNLNFAGVWPNSGPGDTLSSSGSHHIWYDHLELWDAEDGLLDITNTSDYQTVSWSKFRYTDAGNGHRLASLNGSGGGDHPEDWGNLRVTYHHNWWGELVTSRMPRVVYGQGHQFNNYFNSPGNEYCIGVGSYGSILVENNYFKDVNNPHQFMYDVYMYAEASGNIYDNTSGKQDTGHGGTRDACPGGDCSIQSGFDPGPFDPPYAYTLDAAEDVPEIVQRCAGPR